MIGVLLGGAIGWVLVAWVRALRRGWRLSAPAVVDEAVRRATDERIEADLTAGLLSGDVDAPVYRRAVELLAHHD